MESPIGEVLSFFLSLHYTVSILECGSWKSTLGGPFGHKFLRMLLPFWSGALPTLPVTAPSRKERSNADDAQEGRVRQQRPSRMDPRKILLVMAIMACMATMGILYYRLAQRSLGVDIPEDLPQ
ncbi:hypothetical protein M5K25_013292 [Dendrobium thyrsiflorum]|uniref:Uncharacterized protein n=1 Tax=Dendrobium thyrsiflorum TaxID=117978 RepID=A0ABD0UTG3_DENTH